MSARGINPLTRLKLGVHSLERSLDVHDQLAKKARERHVQHERDKLTLRLQGFFAPLTDVPPGALVQAINDLVRHTPAPAPVAPSVPTAPTAPTAPTDPPRHGTYDWWLRLLKGRAPKLHRYKYCVRRALVLLKAFERAYDDSAPPELFDRLDELRADAKSGYNVTEAIKATALRAIESLRTYVERAPDKTVASTAFERAVKTNELETLTDAVSELLKKTDRYEKVDSPTKSTEGAGARKGGGMEILLDLIEPTLKTTNEKGEELRRTALTALLSVAEAFEDAHAGSRVTAPFVRAALGVLLRLLRPAFDSERPHLYFEAFEATFERFMGVVREVTALLLAVRGSISVWNKVDAVDEGRIFSGCSSIPSVGCATDEGELERRALGFFGAPERA